MEAKIDLSKCTFVLVDDPEYPDLEEMPPSLEQASPAARVFGVFELCEAILQSDCLSVKDLVRSRRICKMTSQVLKESAPLQKRLFLTPDEQSTFKFNTAGPSHIHFQPYYRPQFCGHRFSTFLSFCSTNIAAAHPKADTIPGWMEAFAARYVVDTDHAYEDMLITQPPVNELVLCTRDKYSGYGSTPSLRLVSEGGIRFCDLKRAASALAFSLKGQDLKQTKYICFDASRPGCGAAHPEKLATWRCGKNARILPAK